MKVKHMHECLDIDIGQDSSAYRGSYRILSLGGTPKFGVNAEDVL